MFLVEVQLEDMHVGWDLSCVEGPVQLVRNVQSVSSVVQWCSGSEGEQDAGFGLRVSIGRSLVFCCCGTFLSISSPGGWQHYREDGFHLRSIMVNCCTGSMMALDTATIAMLGLGGVIEYIAAGVGSRAGHVA